MRLSKPIYKLKRQAKVLARKNNLKLHEALNRIARDEGFKDWGNLSSKYSEPPAGKILSQIEGGDLLLIAALPGHGKTLLGLELATSAKAIDRTGYIFTLAYNEKNVWDGFQKLGIKIHGIENSAIIDTSDDICANYIIERINYSPSDALIFIDYLQLLDQKRSNPPLDEQIRILKDFAEEHGSIFVISSQIDRAFDLSSSQLPCIKDIRLPNPVDLSLFNKRCFLHNRELQFDATT